MLDRSDLADAVRYGPIHRKLIEELKLTQAVVSLYQSGAPAGMLAQVRRVSKSCTASLALFQLSAADILEDLRKSWVRVQSQAELDVMATIRSYGLEERAQVQLKVWQQECGDRLPAMLDTIIDRIRNRLEFLRAVLEHVQPTAKTTNKRVANKGNVEPLVLLYHLSRLAVAWTHEPPDYDGKNTTNVAPVRKSGVDQYVEWLTSPDHRRTRPPIPAFHWNKAGDALRVFSLLRLAIVEDDNMLPQALRQRFRDESGVEIKSQAGAIRVFGSRLPFSELRNAIDLSAELRSEIVRKANPRKYRSPADFPGKLRRAFNVAGRELLAAGCRSAPLLTFRPQRKNCGAAV